MMLEQASAMQALSATASCLAQQQIPRGRNLKKAVQTPASIYPAILTLLTPKPFPVIQKKPPIQTASAMTVILGIQAMARRQENALQKQKTATKKIWGQKKTVSVSLFLGQASSVMKSSQTAEYAVMAGSMGFAAISASTQPRQQKHAALHTAEQIMSAKELFQTPATHQPMEKCATPTANMLILPVAEHQKLYKQGLLFLNQKRDGKKWVLCTSQKRFLCCCLHLF